jgi:cyclic beta-1,2-glucan synthetase
MYRAGIESILGLRRRGETFVVDLCIPRRGLDTITWRFLDSRYEIAVSPQRRCRDRDATPDSAPVNPGGSAVNDAGPTGADRAETQSAEPCSLYKI